MYYCNPINIEYLYQFQKDPQSGEMQIYREAADPSLLSFNGKYYIFASMTLGVWESSDLAQWKYHRLPDNLPLYDYAPDVRKIGEYVYFSASRNTENCRFFRTKDVVNGPYEEVCEAFPFWDPNLFCDDDGRLYFYWGCSSETPIWGVELDQNSMKPLGEKKALIFSDVSIKGFEVSGEDHSELPRNPEEVEKMFKSFLTANNITEDMLPIEHREGLVSMFSRKPFIEGAWVNKFNDRYYLQYAFSGTEYNVYGDGVYESESPLGPFVLAKNNPYSYNPGSFMPGAGHGSTMVDEHKRYWHASTMRISDNHRFERRVGLWQAGLDVDGELYCNQRYGDWPINVNAKDPWAEPDWFLLSYQKPISSDSWQIGHEPQYAVDEDVRTYWRSADKQQEHWLQLDLGNDNHVHAIQINFADAIEDIEMPQGIADLEIGFRYIEKQFNRIKWRIEGSCDGTEFFLIEDKSETNSDLPHDFIVIENGISCRFIRLTIYEMPYLQHSCVSGLRVFGKKAGAAPEVSSYSAQRTGNTEMHVSIAPQVDAVGHTILWGHSPDKLYHSYKLLGATEQSIKALISGVDYYVRVDSFNESGITHGTVTSVKR